MWYVLAACSRTGAVRAHCGHCKSSKTTMATLVPFGGRNTFEATWGSAANAAAANRKTAITAVITRENFIACNLFGFRGDRLRSRYLDAAWADSRPLFSFIC